MSEHIYENPEEYFQAVKDFAEEIDGEVLCADMASKEMPCIGHIIFHEYDGYEVFKHFLLPIQHLRSVKESNPTLYETLRTSLGRLELAKSLSSKND